MLDAQLFRKPIPFYASYAAFYRALRGLKKAPLPRRLDARTLAFLGPDETGRIITNLAAINWIDANGYVSDEFRTLVEAFETDGWPEAIRTILPKTYSFIEGDWNDLTPEKLREAFLSYIGRDADAIRPAETFFLCLAAEGGFPIPDKLYRRVARAISDAHRGGRDAPRDDDGDVVHIADDGILEPTNLNRTAMATAALKLKKDVWSDWVDKLLSLTSHLDEMTEQEKDAVLVLLAFARKRKDKGL
jgi:hypothetical protein